jgi:hypothetical protein
MNQMNIRNYNFNSSKGLLNLNKFGNSFNLRKRHSDSADDPVLPKKHNGIRR